MVGGFRKNLQPPRRGPPPGKCASFIRVVVSPETPPPPPPHPPGKYNTPELLIHVYECVNILVFESTEDDQIK